MTIPTLRTFRAQVLLASIFLVLGLVSCGRKGPPVPPRLVAPAGVGSSRAEARDSAIVVTWSRPSRNEDGSPLTDLVEFRLYRAVGPAPPQEARERPTFSLLATIRADQPDNATVRGLQYAFRDDGGGPGLTPGFRYFYRIQPVNRRGVLGQQSGELFVDFSPAPAAPVDLTAIAGDGVVSLTWQSPPTHLPTGAPLVRGYNVYRGVQLGKHDPQPITAGPVVETRFRDAAVENETTYYYVVRSVGLERPSWRESVDSNEVSATPLDLTPPAPPRRLMAVPGQGVISLGWDASPEPDLLGYLVYRLEPPALVPARLTEAPVQATAFEDRTVKSGATYTYTVTAVDRSPRRNESAPSWEVSVTLP